MGWTAPRTWTDGETVTETEMNAHVRDNLNALGGWTATYPDTAWADITLGNSWVVYGTGRANRYRRRNGVVFLNIMAKNGTTTTATVIATLPTGFRPIHGMSFAADTNAAYCRVKIDSNGEIRLYGATVVWVDINVSFVAEG